MAHPDRGGEFTARVATDVKVGPVNFERGPRRDEPANKHPTHVRAHKLLKNDHQIAESADRSKALALTALWS